MAEIVARRLMAHLECSEFVVMKRPPEIGAAEAEPQKNIDFSSMRRYRLSTATALQHKSLPSGVVQAIRVGVRQTDTMSTPHPNPQFRIAALAPKYARLLAVLKSSFQSVECGGKATRSDVVDLQRRAIAALQECAEIAASLAQCLDDGACPRDVTCLHLGEWNSCNACSTRRSAGS
ncbi:hypothetical protein [Roseiarcus sp.]|uniref:hypothetical protein n=1 Tax=Roseiarcus sp. TaxID=1969460 RepID=UPI003F9CC0B3